MNHTQDSINVSWRIDRRLPADHVPDLPRRRSDPIGQTTGTTFTDTGLMQGSTHRYTVDAVESSTT